MDLAVFIMVMCLIRLCFAAMVSRVDLGLGDYLTQLRRQTTKRKLNSFEMVGKGNSTVLVDIVPPITTVPPVIWKRGRLARAA